MPQAVASLFLLSVVVGSCSAYGKEPDPDPWETSPPAGFWSSHECLEIDPAVIVPVPPQHRPEAIGDLESVPAIELGQREVSALLDVSDPAGTLGPTRIEAAIAELNQQRRSALAGHTDSWSTENEERLDHLRILSASTAALRPYLVRAVVMNERTGTFSASVCNGTLVVSHESLGHQKLPSKRAPIVVFLNRSPTCVYVTWRMVE